MKRAPMIVLMGGKCLVNNLFEGYTDDTQVDMRLLL